MRTEDRPSITLLAGMGKLVNAFNEALAMQKEDCHYLLIRQNEVKKVAKQHPLCQSYQKRPAAT